MRKDTGWCFEEGLRFMITNDQEDIATEKMQKRVRKITYSN